MAHGRNVNSTAVVKVNLGGADTTNELSPALWSKAPLDYIINGSVGSGYAVVEDFIGTGTYTSATPKDGFVTYQDTGVTLIQLAGVAGGQLQIAGNDADNDEGHLFVGDGVGAPFSVTSVSGSKVWFEIRMKTATVANNGIGWFVGLCQPALGANGLVDDTAALADNNFIGFQVLQADGDAVQAIYKADGQTQQDKGSDIATMANDTWIKLGFKFDAADPDGNVLKWYVNNEHIASATATNIAAATFPSGDDLTAGILTKVGAAAAVLATIDWIAVAQER